MAAEVNKPDFSYQWASGGAIVTPSNVKIQTGWTAEVPPFQWENYLQNRQDNAIVHLFQKGISEWDAASNYYFTTSGTRSYVQGSDGLIYVAVQDSIGQNPTTDLSDTYWKVAFADNGTALTTVTGDARYAQRANNLSDLASPSTALANLAGAPLASPALTGVPTAPTAALGTNTTQIATTAFLINQFTAAGQRLLSTPAGYQKLPGGFIIQWLRVSVTAGGTGSLHTLPTAFPTAMLAAAAVDNAATSASTAYQAWDPVTSTLSAIKLVSSSSSGTDETTAIVLGY